MSALNQIMQQISARENEKVSTLDFREAVKNEKRKLLLPIAALLKEITAGQVLVRNQLYYEMGRTELPDVAFKFYEDESSPSFAPGVSLYFDHPALVEIGVTQKDNAVKYHIVVGSEHPDSFDLQKTLTNVEDVKKLLIRFVGKNALGVKKPSP